MQSLPIKLSPHDGESGNGFLLRALSQNGISFSQAANWLKVSWCGNVKSDNHLTWSWAVGVEPAWLSRRLVQIRRDGEHRVYGLHGHQWRVKQSFRLTHPQVCVKCVHEFGYIPAAWDLIGVSMCLRHGEFLSNVCSTCKQLLVWNRPTIAVCGCKRFLTQPASARQPSEDLIRWTQWLCDRMQMVDQESCTPLLVGLPREMSADGAFRLLLAFGFRTHAFQVLRTHLLSNRSTPEQVGDILGRGYNRLSLALETGGWRELASLLHEETLERMELNGINQADRDLARRLRIEVLGSSSQRDPARRPNAKGQLELYPESAP